MLRFIHEINFVNEMGCVKKFRLPDLCCFTAGTAELLTQTSRWHRLRHRQRVPEHLLLVEGLHGGDRRGRFRPG